MASRTNGTKAHTPCALFSEISLFSFGHFHSRDHLSVGQFRISSQSDKPRNNIIFPRSEKPNRISCDIFPRPGKIDVGIINILKTHFPRMRGKFPDFPQTHVKPSRSNSSSSIDCMYRRKSKPKTTHSRGTLLVPV